MAIKNRFPFYDLIFSEFADIMYPLTPETINTIQEQDLFKLISLPYYYNNNFDFLKSIKHRSNIELSINNICGCCSKECYKNCILTEHNNIYNYSDSSILNNCTNFYSYNDSKSTLITLKDI
jgi:hypothetical protein